jgi:hypothetical protein
MHLFGNVVALLGYGKQISNLSFSDIDSNALLQAVSMRSIIPMGPYQRF